MGRRRKKLLILPKVELTGIADKGKAVGRHEGKVVFVEGGAAPGDVVDVKVIKKNKSYYVGLPIFYHKKSEDRVEPFCEYFGECGGCKWQHLSYDKQVEYKNNITHEVIERIGKIEVPNFLPILPAEETTYYRNKMEFSFSNKRWLSQEEVDSGAEFPNRNALGFHRPKSFDKIIDIHHCHLQGEPSNAIRNAVREFVLEHDYTFFDIRQQVGLMRGLMIRTSTLGECLVIVIFHEDDPEKRKALMDHLVEKFPNITSLQYVINHKANSFFLDLDIHLYNGRDFIYEVLGHLKFKIGPKSFFQTNTKQALRLYNVIADFAELTGEENVYDLYTGIGSIALFVANRCKHVVGIEEIEGAIDDAKINMSINQIENATFYVGDVKDILTTDFSEQHGKPDFVITDPPRAGMHKKVVETLLALEAPKMVYVSCNPATQARDINLLSEKYEVVKMQPVDMFPHTHHIENVALLQLKTEVNGQ